jgi:hypothetical protein
MSMSEMEVESMKSTAKNGKVGTTIPQALEIIGERRMIKLVIGAVEFCMTEMQEHDMELGHIDFVLSQ